MVIVIIIIYGNGSAADCRTHVQKLNMMRGEREAAILSSKSEQHTENDCRSIQESPEEYSECDYRTIQEFQSASNADDLRHIQNKRSKFDNDDNDRGGHNELANVAANKSKKVQDRSLRTQTPGNENSGPGNHDITSTKWDIFL
ncbi:hypothetical protein TrispH2_011734 [Trichoplax sp. H2]|nr:hypothetical protein TrispH2_011734 [Trichoplax sp. H2]|eukprot:RDD36005.1 hypothetical protein TrispH2_011734 [Trichoplax sp. H2]